MMRVRMLFVALAVAPLAACASYTSPTDMLLQPPPPLEGVTAEIDAKSCDSTQRVYASSYENPERETPTRVSGCLAHMPRALLDARVQGQCGSMFDVDDAGKPVNVVTRCNVGSPRMKLSDEWAVFAEAVFLHSIEKQFATWRYQAAGEKPAAERRHSLYMQNLFGIEGERVPIAWPQPFQRPPPAPTLPPDLAKRAAEANPS